uniref:DNA polymerase alpha subunit B n=1 Tax=Dromaius novaehollandiae TaxID=8790 RepID=A0A8C4PC98_DRONO
SPRFGPAENGLASRLAAACLSGSTVVEEPASGAPEGSTRPTPPPSSVPSPRPTTSCDTPNALQHPTTPCDTLQHPVTPHNPPRHPLSAPQGPQKRGGSSPETPRPKRTPSARSPYGLLSPGSFSPSTTPAQHYASRGGRGDVVASLGVPGDPGGTGTGGSCDLKLFTPPERSLTRSYKFMFQKALDVREVLSWRIEELGEALRERYGLEEFASAGLPAQEPVTVLGQIGCDGNGKLNAKSVVLEGDRERSAGARVPLDLSELPEYSLFPGQVVAVEGTNSTGRRLVASKLYEGVPLPFYAPPEPEPEPGAAQRLVLAACGPYTTSDSLAYAPLADLVAVVARDKPDVCVLVRPRCRLLGSFADVFKLCVRTIVEGTRSAGCQLVFVPSLRDVHHDYVYPQPPFACAELPKEDRPRVHFVSDPCTLEIGGAVFGLTSTDLLFHMGAEEISSSSGLSDRLTRILRHVLTQRSYYPLYPPAEELNVDYESFWGHAALPVTPDVLVVPSELRYFVKDVLGCVCVNPGRLTKGRVGGTYGRLYVRRRPAEGRRENPCVAAQVVRI